MVVVSSVLLHQSLMKERKKWSYHKAITDGAITEVRSADVAKDSSRFKSIMEG